jgi:hypothetical protein
LAIFAACCAPAAHPEPDPTLVVRIVNSARVPAGTLRDAETLAAHIFHQAGVEIAWVETGPADFWLHLLKDKPRRLPPDAAGFTVLMPPGAGAASYAAVSYAVVVEQAAALRAGVAQFLGAAIAHELGHLLLGPNSHAPGGIMAPRFHAQEISLAGRGVLLFDSDQAKALRAGVLARTEPVPGSAVAH